MTAKQTSGPSIGEAPENAEEEGVLEGKKANPKRRAAIDPTTAASKTATRKLLSESKDRNCRAEHPPGFSPAGRSSPAPAMTPRIAIRANEAVTTHAAPSAMASRMAASATRAPLPARMCLSARPTSAGRPLPTRRRSARVRGKVFRYAAQAKPSSAALATAKLERQAISAKPSEGLRKMRRKPSRVGEGWVMNDSSPGLDGTEIRICARAPGSLSAPRF